MTNSIVRAWYDHSENNELAEGSFSITEKRRDQFILKLRKPSDEDVRRPRILSVAEGQPAKPDEEEIGESIR